MAVCLAVACGGGGATPDGGGTDRDARAGDAARGDDGGGGVDGGEAIETLSLTVGPFNTPEGTERVLCASFDLGNDAPVMVRGVRTHLSPGSHHMIVYHLTGSPDPTPRACGSFEHGIGQSIFIAQQPEASLQYPAGAGYPFAAHQTIGIEIHFINYVSPDPIDVTGTVDFDFVAADDSLDVVELLFTGDLTLELPPRTTTTETCFHPIDPSYRVFGLTSHTHQLGELATLERAHSATEPIELLHRSTSWADPPLDIFDPPLTFAPGDGLLLTCDFNNTTDHTVYFGTGFDDEMCFFWAYVIR